MTDTDYLLADADYPLCCCDDEACPGCLGCGRCEECIGRFRGPDCVGGCAPVGLAGAEGVAADAVGGGGMMWLVIMLAALVGVGWRMVRRYRVEAAMWDGLAAMRAEMAVMRDEMAAMRCGLRGMTRRMVDDAVSAVSLAQGVSDRDVR